MPMSVLAAWIALAFVAAVVLGLFWIFLPSSGDGLSGNRQIMPYFTGRI